VVSRILFLSVRLSRSACHGGTRPGAHAASVLGHTPETIFYLADYGDTCATSKLWRQLPIASKLFTVGKSTRGQDIEVAVISTPANLARLDEAKKAPDAWRVPTT